WVWASGRGAPKADPQQALLERAVRVPDPTVRLDGPWLVRRLAPHCRRIELADLPAARQELRLLYAMGFETANIHLGRERACGAVRRELGRRRSRWLHDLAKTCADAVEGDWTRWRKYQKANAS